MRLPESFIGQPIRSLQTMLRVIAEDDNSYIRIMPDGIYGPETISAVSRFQKKHGLPVTGITDQSTWEAIVAEYDPALVRQDSAWPLDILMEPGQVIRQGERHPHVFLVQAMLAVLSDAYQSIPQPALTGILDGITADSLAAFQQLSRLPATGHLDKLTWKHLALHYPLASALKRDMGKYPAYMPG